VLPAGIIYGKGKFAANGDETARNVRLRKGAQVPSIKEKKNGLIGYSYQIPLVAHDFQPFCQVAINPFNKHWIVICTG
jgi:hypothetical protein